MRAPTPGTSRSSAKSAGPRSAAAASAPCSRRSITSFGRTSWCAGMTRCGSSGARSAPAGSSAATSRDDAGPGRARAGGRAAAPARRRRARSVRLTISPPGRAVDRRVRRLDEARRGPRRASGSAARCGVVAVHALLHHDPLAVVGDDEAVQVELEAVLHRGAVDLGDQPARPRQRRAVEAGAHRRSRRARPGVRREWRPRPPQTWRPSSPRRGASPRFSAPSTLVVMPDECQSIPITAPNDWNQNGCASRRRNSSRP